MNPIETTYNSSRMTRTVNLPDGRKVKYARTGMDDVETHRRQIIDPTGAEIRTDVLSRESGDWVLVTSTLDKAQVLDIEEEHVDALEEQWFNYTVNDARDAANNPDIDLDALTA